MDSEHKCETYPLSRVAQSNNASQSYNVATKYRCRHADDILSRRKIFHRGFVEKRDIFSKIPEQHLDSADG